MNGATADDSEKMIRKPSSTRNTTSGNSQIFFLTLRNSQSSSRMPSFAIGDVFPRPAAAGRDDACYCACPDPAGASGPDVRISR